MGQAVKRIDSLDPGDLGVRVPGGLQVQVMHPVTGQRQDRPVRCPWCQGGTDLLLRTGPRDATVICDQGHAWTDIGVRTAAVPQLHALARHGGVPIAAPVLIPQTASGVWLWLLPDAEAPGAGGEDLPVTEAPDTAPGYCWTAARPGGA
ncbi:hypothetical protein [Streptacidiphilus sp. EB103A]|uniref:hypothetical protein n=1 Tax=Streptacidiphilus sp. EB103A TaxID=3156275 RepID=UPI0035140D48